MQNAENQQRLSFNCLNSALLKSSAKPGFCPYVWVDNSVALKNPSFDEVMFRKCKMARMVDMNTALSIAELQKILDSVIRDNARIILDISYATQDKWQSCDAQFNEILDATIKSAGAEAELRIAQKYVLVAPEAASKLEFPAQSKFINKSRH